MKLPAIGELLDVARKASDAAAAHAMANLGRRKEVAQAFDHDVKLALDLECQQKAEAEIRRHFPTHAILGEETPPPAAGAGPLWVIDPIDGTVNFSHGLRYWCNSIAVQLNGETLAGVVQAPELDEVYAATVDGPATLNGQDIRVSETPWLRESLALTGIAKTFDKESRALDVLRNVALHCRKIRLMGAAALDICQCASGRVDAFFESNICLWDMAAGDLIVRRAGGRAAILEQLDDLRMRYVCSNAAIYDELRRVIDRAGEP